MILSPHRILWYSYSPPSLPPPHWQPMFYSSPFFLYWRRLTPFPPPPPPPFHLKANGIPPKNLPHLSENEWKLVPNRVGKAVSSFEKMTKSHIKSYTDKLQDITCARGWDPVFIFVWQTQVDVLSVHVQVTWRLWNYLPLALHDTRLCILLDRRVTHLAPQLTPAMRKETHPSALIEQ